SVQGLDVAGTYSTVEAPGTGNGGSAGQHGFAGGREVSHPDEESGRRIFYGSGGVPGGKAAGAAGLHVGLGEGRERRGVWRGGGEAVANDRRVSETGQGDRT